MSEAASEDQKTCVRFAGEKHDGWMARQHTSSSVVWPSVRQTSSFAFSEKHVVCGLDATTAERPLFGFRLARFSPLTNLIC